MRTAVAVSGLVFVAVGVASVLVLSDGTPGEAGPYAIGEVTTELADDERERSMEILIFYPLGAVETPDVGYPLVVFNHGFLLSGQGYRSYGERLASHGFVVALPTFPMTLLNVHHGELAEDVRFVIDACLAASADEGHPLSGLIDEERIGVSGHSLGGKLSLLEAVSDDRVRAAALLDPVDGGSPILVDPKRYPSVAPERMAELRIPLLLIGAELGSKAVFFTACAPETENYQRFFEAANSPAIEVTQLGVGHGQYLDGGFEAMTSTCAVGDVSSEWVRNSSAGYLTAFFLGVLTGSQTALDWLDAQLAFDEGEGRILVRRR